MPHPQSPQSSTLPASRNPSGFTLVELLIAMLIAVILSGVVIYLFGQTQRATRTSVAVASLSVTAATVDARLRLDAASLLGPNRMPGEQGGCLVIVPAVREGYIPLVNGQMSKNKVRLRSDQLVFMTCRQPSSGHPWLSLLPPDQNKIVEAATQPTDRSSWEARIWYGGLRDTNLSPVPDSPDNPYWAAHLWSMGRQAKLFVGANAATSGDCTVTGTGDTVAGTLPALKDSAFTVAGGIPTAVWTDQDYLDKLIGPGIPDNQGKYTNQPAVSPRIDLKALGRGQAEQGIQLNADVVQNTLKLFDNCSEIVIQWAGDLDKDGIIDVYPPGHPLAGSIIWYPEELHTNAQKDATTKLRLSASLLAKYNAMASYPWKWTFDLSSPSPGSFSTSASRFGGHGFGSKGFEFEYGDTDHTTTPAPTGTPVIPAPYVFHFEDDQYRLARYGFRQDGSVYANQWNGKPLPAGTGTLHAFPYPPLGYLPTALNANFSPTDNKGAVVDPYTSQLYKGKAAPGGPYPRAAAAAGANGQNFGDLMGEQPLLGSADVTAAVNVSTTGPNGEKYRTGGNGIPNDPNQYGQWVKVSYSSGTPWFVYPLPTASLALTTPSGGTAPVAPAIYSAEQIAALTAAPVWPYYAGGQLVLPNQMGGSIASVAKPGDDPTPDTPAAQIPGLANPISPMDQRYGAANNYTRTYTDLWAEYLKPINAPAAGQPDKRGTIEDWRMPQSDWPRLIRIRVRLHDPQGLVTSYSDEFLLNGRDNDGDGVVNNPEEGRISGLWFEYVIAIPSTTNAAYPAYPLDAANAPYPAPPGYGGALPYRNPGPRNH